MDNRPSRRAASTQKEKDRQIVLVLQGGDCKNWVGSMASMYGLTPRWATTNAADIRKHAAEFAALAPDVILAPGASTVGPLLQATRTVPIMFPIIVDPVAGGFVDSPARPGGNATGFMLFEYSISGKWLELLKQIAPGVTRVAVLGNTDTSTGPAQFRRHSGRGAGAQGGSQFV